MRANVYGRYDRELMVSTYSEKLARLYKAQLELYKLIIEDAETSEIEAAVSRLAALSFELTQMPDIPETVKEWREQIMEKAFPKNAISGSPNCAARGTAPLAAGSGVPGQMVTPRDAAGGLTAGTALGRGPGTRVINWRATPGTENDAAERARRHDKARDIAGAPVAARANGCPLVAGPGGPAPRNSGVTVAHPYPKGI